MRPLYTKIKVTNNTQTQKLPIFDQLRLLLGKVSDDENIQMEAEEKISKANIEMKSSLSNLIDSVTKKMNEIGSSSVTLSISSRFKPYFESVLSSTNGKGRFYNFEIVDNNMSIKDADYFIIMKIIKKED
jgi:2-hydroxy-3-keto-5-methylthiopentenyl-1-phosphate phosphatase